MQDNLQQDIEGNSIGNRRRKHLSNAHIPSSCFQAHGQNQIIMKLLNSIVYAKTSYGQ